jgi:hypothetical protein
MLSFRLAYIVYINISGSHLDRHVSISTSVTGRQGNGGVDCRFGARRQDTGTDGSQRIKHRFVVLRAFCACPTEAHSSSSSSSSTSLSIIISASPYVVILLPFLSSIRFLLDLFVIAYPVLCLLFYILYSSLSTKFIFHLRFPPFYFSFTFLFLCNISVSSHLASLYLPLLFHSFSC